MHLGNLLAGLGGVSLAAGRRLYLSLGYHWLGGRGLVIVGLRRVGLDMELHVRIIVQVVKVVVSLVLVQDVLYGLVMGAVMRGEMKIMSCMVAVLMMRGQRVVREGEVVIDEVRVMRRHNHTPKLSREDGRNRWRWRRRGWGTGISRKLEARLVVLEVLHHPGHDVIRELAGGQCAAEWRVDRLSWLDRCLSSVQLLPLISGLDGVSKDGIETRVRRKKPCRPLTTLASVVDARKARGQCEGLFWGFSQKIHHLLVSEKICLFSSPQILTQMLRIHV